MAGKNPSKIVAEAFPSPIFAVPNRTDHSRLVRSLLPGLKDKAAD